LVVHQLKKLKQRLTIGFKAGKLQKLTISKRRKKRQRLADE
jgi:hypothetical protein